MQGIKISGAMGLGCDPYFFWFYAELITLFVCLALLRLFKEDVIAFRRCGNNPKACMIIQFQVLARVL